MTNGNEALMKLADWAERMNAEAVEALEKANQLAKKGKDNA